MFIIILHRILGRHQTSNSLKLLTDSPIRKAVLCSLKEDQLQVCCLCIRLRAGKCFVQISRSPILWSRILQILSALHMNSSERIKDCNRLGGNFRFQKKRKFWRNIHSLPHGFSVLCRWKVSWSLHWSTRGSKPSKAQWKTVWSFPTFFSFFLFFLPSCLGRKSLMNILESFFDIRSVLLIQFSFL